MKLWLLLFSFVFLLNVNSACAQDNCDTLILYPDLELIVNVDSVYDNTLYARLCGGASDQIEAIPLKMIKTVNGSGLSGLITDKKEGKPESAPDIKTTSVPKGFSAIGA